MGSVDVMRDTIVDNRVNRMKSPQIVEENGLTGVVIR